MGMSIPSPAPIFLLKVWDLPREEAEAQRTFTERSGGFILKRVGFVSAPRGFDWHSV